jgi:Amino acid permease
VIGSGIFVVPSLIAQRVPEPGLVIAIWVFSGVLVLCGALALAELGTMLPQSGGLYIYMREAYGSFWAFLYGWTIGGPSRGKRAGLGQRRRPVLPSAGALGTETTYTPRGHRHRHR